MDPEACGKQEADAKFIVDGPEQDVSKYNEKLLKVIIKEGGKRGVEIEGAADMGGLKFFCTAMEKPDGDIVLLTESMKAMNARSDPTEEERKGGAGRIGKMLLSMNDDKLCLVTYVPKDLSDQCSAKEWLEYVVKMVTDSKEEKYATFEKCGDVDEKNYYRCVIKADTENNVFPIKMRDPAVTEAYAYLKKRDLFPDGDDEDDDDYVFGDEDFPSM